MKLAESYCKCHANENMISAGEVNFQMTVEQNEDNDENNAKCCEKQWKKEDLNAVNDVVIPVIPRMDLKDNIVLEKEEEIIEENISNKTEIKEKPSDVWIHATCNELSELTICQLKNTLSNLKIVVEDVSSELVKLLQERQALQEEADVRNIAIEQLLKVYDKFGWKLNDTITIQMSVLPQSPEKAIDCT